MNNKNKLANFHLFKMKKIEKKMNRLIKIQKIKNKIINMINRWKKLKNKQIVKKL